MVKQKIKLKLLFCLFLALLFLCVGSMMYLSNVKAEPKITKECYDTIYLNELNKGYGHDSSPRLPDGSINVVNGGRFGFNQNIKNAEIVTKINFSAMGRIGMIMRAQGDSVMTAGVSGYSYTYYPNGMYSFYDGSNLIHEGWGSPFGELSTGVDYIFKMKTVNLVDNLGDVQGVYVSVSVNDMVVYEYTDTQEAFVNGGWFAMNASAGATYLASGAREEQGGINLLDMSLPYTSSNFIATINDNNTVSTSAAGSVGPSGVGFSFQASGGYGIKTTVTPSEVAGNFSFTVGAKKTNSNEMNRPGVMDETWGWSESGYTLLWSANGQLQLYRNDILLEYIWSANVFEANKSYQIEYGFICLDGGSVVIYFKIDGVQQVLCVDVKTDTNTPIAEIKLNVTPADLVSYALVLSTGVASEFDFGNRIEYETKSQLTKDLGNPTINISSATKLDRNGQIVFAGGLVAGYSEEFQNTSVVSKINFSSMGTNLALTLRAAGAYDTPWGGGWTNKGYTVYFYPNGQIVLNKNGISICEGWATGGFGFALNTDYSVEFGTVNLPNAVRVFAKINDSLILNYIDYNNSISQSGWYCIYSDGFAGTINADIELPTLSTQGNVSEIYQGASIGLNIDNGGVLPQSVQYIIDNDSIGGGTITNNIFTASHAGLVKITALVDGLYTNDLSFTILGREVTVANLPLEPLVAGGGTHTISASISPEEELLSKVFAITSGNEFALIDANTGLITPIKVGIITVTATINGISSSPIYIEIVAPTVKLLGIDNQTELVARRDSVVLSYDINIVVYNSTVTYSVTDDNVAVIVGQELRGLNKGRVGVKVCVDGIESATIYIYVVPIVSIFNVSTMVIGETKTLQLNFNCEVDEVLSVTFSLISGDCVILQTNSGVLTATKIGRALVKVTVDGIESELYEFSVETPTVRLTNYKDILVGESLQLDGHINGNLSIVSKTFNIVNGSECAQLDSTNGLLTSLSAGTVRISVTINGIQSAVETLMVTEVQLVINCPESWEVNQSFELSYFTNYEDMIIESLVYSLAKDGSSQFVDLDSNNFVISEVGVYTIKLNINGLYTMTTKITIIDSNDPNLSFSNITDTLYVNYESLPLTYKIDKEDFNVFSVLYQIISGNDIARLENNILTATGEGEIVIKVIINNQYSATKTFYAKNRPKLLITNTQTDFIVGDSVKITIELSKDLSLQSINYEIIEGKDIATIKNNVLTFNSSGSVVIKVSVNDLYSAEMTFNVSEESDKGSDLGLILGITIPLGTVSLGSAVAAAIYFVVKRRRRN